MDDKKIEIVFSEEVEQEYEETKKAAIETSLERYHSSVIAKLEYNYLKCSGDCSPNNK